MVPSFHSSDDVVWISGPGEGFRVIVCFGDEAIDGGLEIDQGVEDAAFELPSCEFGEEAFDGVEPGGGCWREVEYKLLMAVEPGPNLWVLVYGIVIKDDVDGFVRWNLGVDHVQKADEFLVPVALHIAPDNGPVEDIQGGKEGCGSIAFVVVGHGAQTSFFHRQARLGTVKRLDLAFLIDRQDDGVGWRIDIEANDIAQFGDKIRIAGELELPIAVRLQAMRSPDAPDRCLTDANRRGHHRGRPMGRLDRRVRHRQRHDAFGHVGGQRRNAWWTRFVTKKAIDAFFHEPLLPAPDAGLRFARLAHDLVRSNAGRAQKDDGRPPYMFLGGAAVPDNAFETKEGGRTDFDRDTSAHALDPQMRTGLGIPERTLLLSGNH